MKLTASATAADDGLTPAAAAVAAVDGDVDVDTDWRADLATPDGFVLPAADFRGESPASKHGDVPDAWATRRGACSRRSESDHFSLLRRQPGCRGRGMPRHGARAGRRDGEGMRSRRHCLAGSCRHHVEHDVNHPFVTVAVRI